MFVAALLVVGVISLHKITMFFPYLTPRKKICPRMWCSIFSTGKRASKSLLQQIKEVIDSIPNLTKRITSSNVEELWIQVCYLLIMSPQNTELILFSAHKYRWTKTNQQMLFVSFKCKGKQSVLMICTHTRTHLYLHAMYNLFRTPLFRYIPCTSVLNKMTHKKMDYEYETKANACPTYDESEDMRKLEQILQMYKAEIEKSSVIGARTRNARQRQTSAVTTAENES